MTFRVTLSFRFAVITDDNPANRWWRNTRKFLQMGFTRARRYTNYKGGRKYDPEDKHPLEKGTGDPQKAESAGSSSTPGRRPRPSPPTRR